MQNQADDRRAGSVWLSLGLAAGCVIGYKVWHQHKARATSPLIHEREILWAMVTHATSGIGAVYASRLAERGYNLILVSEKANNLDRLAEFLAGEFQVRVQVLTADLTTQEGVEQVESYISGLANLNLLVNNATFDAGSSPTDTGKVQDDELHRHITTCIRLTRAALPGMLAQKRGAVVNISSIQTISSRDYLNAFIKALHRQLAGSGVRVQALYPGDSFKQKTVVTSFTAEEQLLAEKAIDRSLRDLAVDRVISAPSFAHKLSILSTPFLPASFRQLTSTEMSRIKSPSSQFAGFQKRTWKNLREFSSDMRLLLRNRERIHEAMQVLDKDLYHRLMLLVTHINGCRYCAYVNARTALDDGITREEIEVLLTGVLDSVPEKEIPALLYALYWAEEGGSTEVTIRQDLVDRYGDEQVQAIDTALQMIKVGNYMGNALDFFLFTISGGRWGNTTP